MTAIPTLSPETQTVEQTAEAPRARVVLVNDDFTPMDFVVEILHDYFEMNEVQAESVMMAVHTQGRGLCGVYEVPEANRRAETVVRIARTLGHPLNCEVEPIDRSRNS